MVQAQEDSIDKILRHYAGVQGGLLPCLHALQAELGYIVPAAIPRLAKAFNQSRAEIWGTLSFYSFFKTEPPKPFQIQICQAESCQSMGARSIFKSVSAYITQNANLAELVDAEAVYCFGNCACSPCARIGDEILGEVTSEQLTAAIDALVSGGAHG